MDRYENGQVPPPPLPYRYTAQLFHPGVISGSYSRARNLDAIFPPGVLQHQLPHPVILNYAYGYAVLLRWGKQIPTVITHLRTFTLFVRSAHVPWTPGTIVSPPSIPCVPTSMATRVTSTQVVAPSC
jgi:hypothetical protein